MCEGMACWLAGFPAMIVGLVASGGCFALLVEMGWPWPAQGWKKAASGLFLAFWAALLVGALAGCLAFVGLSLLLGLLGG